MLGNNYIEAKKKGINYYRKMVSKGTYPYLPVLDSILQNGESSSGNSLGLLNIPSEFVIGTKTEGRSNAFAGNFLPIMEEGSEFATKWEQLCQSHIEEGIREPVKAYEYMNRYYIEEGNKRVSVLKYFESPFIQANVIQILPQSNDSIEVELYQELLKFRKVSGILFLEFSQKGRYKELLHLLGKNHDQIWSQEERQEFEATYYLFKKLYEQKIKSSKGTNTTTADALLGFLNIYKYEEVLRFSEKEMKQNLQRTLEDISLMKEESPIQIQSQPEDKSTLLGTFDQIYQSALGISKKIAFIHDKDAKQSGWTNQHEMGRMHAQEVFGKKIQTKAYFYAFDENPEEVITKAIEEGYKIIFTTSARLMPASLKVAIKNPSVMILNCSVNISHRYIQTYYGRMYEAKFIAGAIAGSLCEDGKIGYVCKYPIYGSIADINAFALGVQMINPQAKIYLQWASVGSLESAIRTLMEDGIRLISSLDGVALWEKNYRTYGLFWAKNNKLESLAIPVCNWGVYYEKLIQRILDGTIRHEYEESQKALNYYWGMSADVVDILCSDAVTSPVQKLATFLKESIRSGNCNPFMGKFISNTGETYDFPAGKLELKEVVEMNYLAENVIGTIPTYEDLDETTKETVDVVGVQKNEWRLS